MNPYETFDDDVSLDTDPPDLTLREEDLRMLRELCEDEDKLWDRERHVFPDMLDCLTDGGQWTLTAAQRRWVADAHERVFG
jgi:hypothetical protein